MSQNPIDTIMNAGSVGADTLAQAVADMNATVVVLQDGMNLLVEKETQLANHERLMGTISDHGHIKIGTGFERMADGTVNVTGTSAFEGIMEAHEANATAHGISVAATPNAVVKRDASGNIAGNVTGTARYA